MPAYGIAVLQDCDLLLLDTEDGVAQRWRRSSAVTLLGATALAMNSPCRRRSGTGGVQVFVKLAIAAVAAVLTSQTPFLTLRFAGDRMPGLLCRHTLLRIPSSPQFVAVRPTLDADVGQGASSARCSRPALSSKPSSCCAGAVRERG